MSVEQDGNNGTPTGEIHDPRERQLAAMRLSEKLGRQLAIEHPTIAEMYRSGLTRDQIAEVVLNEPEIYSRIVRRQAVGHAVRELIPDEEERRELLLRGNARRFQQWKQELGEEGLRQHQQNAARQRHSSGIGVDVNAMIRGRGRTPWDAEEKVYAVMISQLPIFQYTKKVYKGKPNASKIAFQVNEIFHDGEPVRTASSVNGLFKGLRAAAKKEQARS